jgi:hypothetical protein
MQVDLAVIAAGKPIKKPPLPDQMSRGYEMKQRNSSRRFMEAEEAQ